MTTALDIANRALSAIGARSGATGSVSALQSFNEQSNEAFQVNLLFNSTRDDLLRGAHWNFTRKTAVLSLLKSAPGTPGNPVSGFVQWSAIYPAPPWRFEYSYPSDCLKMRQIQRNWSYAQGGYGYSFPFGGYAGGYSERDNAKFLVSTDADSSGNPMNVVLTDVIDAIGVYTAQITNPAQWDPSFAQCMVAALSARLAMPLVGDKQLQQMMTQEAQGYVMNARVNDGNEGTTQSEVVPDWIAVRGWGGSGVVGSYLAGWDAIPWLGI